MDKHLSAFDLSQEDANELIQMPKIAEHTERIFYPGLGGVLEVPLQSINKRERFRLTMVRGRINLEKASYQSIGRKMIVLIRLDLGGPPHRNPDDQVVPCPHIHIYREGWDDKWASTLDTSVFSNIDDLWQSLHDFMNYCNVVQKPNIHRTLGS